MADGHAFDITKPRFSLESTDGHHPAFEPTLREALFFHALGCYAVVRSKYDGQSFKPEAILQPKPMRLV